MPFGHLIAKVPNPWLDILRQVLRRSQQCKKKIRSWAAGHASEPATKVEKQVNFLKEPFREARLGTQKKDTLAIHLGKAIQCHKINTRAKRGHIGTVTELCLSNFKGPGLENHIQIPNCWSRKCRGLFCGIPATNRVCNTAH